MFRNQNNTSLGKLETEIMDIVWKLKTASVRSVLDQLNKKRPVAYTTIMTVMTRLHAKGILKRHDNNGAYLYSPAEEKEKFLAKISEKVIKNLIKNYGELAVAQFIDIVESSHLKKSADWQKRLKKIR